MFRYYRESQSHNSTVKSFSTSTSTGISDTEFDGNEAQRRASEQRRLPGFQTPIVRRGGRKGAHFFDGPSSKPISPNSPHQGEAKRMFPPGPPCDLTSAGTIRKAGKQMSISDDSAEKEPSDRHSLIYYRDLEHGREDYLLPKSKTNYALKHCLFSANLSASTGIWDTKTQSHLPRRRAESIGMGRDPRGRNHNSCSTGFEEALVAGPGFETQKLARLEHFSHIRKHWDLGHRPNGIWDTEHLGLRSPSIWASRHRKSRQKRDFRHGESAKLANLLMNATLNFDLKTLKITTAVDFTFLEGEQCLRINFSK